MNCAYINAVNYIISTTCFFCIYLCHVLLAVGDEGTIIIAAFGASAVLAFSNDVINHSFVKISMASMVAAVVGVFCSQMDLAAMFKVILTISTCILILNLANISYPPAGAIAIIPLISNAQIQELGYLYVLYPTMTGMSIIYLFSKLKEKLNTIYYGKQKNNRNS